MSTSIPASLAPKPEVQHLPTLFRRIQSGEIRVPAFQREFSWEESQIISLLDSVYRGYPIGSLLLWEVNETIFREEATSELPFPRIEAQLPSRFVLDGLQRLASLYGVFHPPSGSNGRLFQVVFGLRDQYFRHLGSEPLRDDEIPLAAMMSPRELLAHQKRLYSLPDSEALIQQTLWLQAVFQEYMIPTVTIAHKNVAEVVEIFRRINSTGTPLGAVDFMRALTWSGDFDLNQQLQRIAIHLGKRNIKPSEETVLKSLAIVVGLDPVSDEMLRLRGRPANELIAAVNRTERALGSSIDFLQSVFQLQSSDFLPYEGQLLALVRFFATDGDPTPAQSAALTKWLWTSSFGEELRGKPDHYLARFLRVIDDLKRGSIAQISGKLQLQPDVWIERRVIKGKALSSTFVSMLARKGARSIFTGQLCPTSDYLSRFEPSTLNPILDVPRLQQAFNRTFPSARTFVNLILLGPDDLPLSSIDVGSVLTSLEQRIGLEDALASFESQFFPRDSLLVFRNDGGYSSLLEARARAMTAYAHELSR